MPKFDKNWQRSRRIEQERAAFEEEAQRKLALIKEAMEALETEISEAPLVGCWLK